MSNLKLKSLFCNDDNSINIWKVLSVLVVVNGVVQIVKIVKNN